jgi:hypothetical protein
MNKTSAVMTEQDFRAAISKQCGFPSEEETLQALQFALAPGPLQLTDTPPESERQILRGAPPFDAQAEREKDLEHESRVDYDSSYQDRGDE